jgi:hypothetical protein
MTRNQRPLLIVLTLGYLMTLDRNARSLNNAATRTNNSLGSGYINALFPPGQRDLNP